MMLKYCILAFILSACPQGKEELTLPEPVIVEPEQADFNVSPDTDPTCHH